MLKIKYKIYVGERCMNLASMLLIDTYFWLLQLPPIREDIEQYALPSAGQRDAANKQYAKDHVRKHDCEVHDLRTRIHNNSKNRRFEKKELYFNL